MEERSKVAGTKPLCRRHLSLPKSVQMTAELKQFNFAECKNHPLIAQLWQVGALSFGDWIMSLNCQAWAILWLVNRIDITSLFSLFYDGIFTFPLFLLNSKKLLLFWIIKQITIKLTVKKLSRLGSTFVYLPKCLSWFNASRSTSWSKHDRNHKFQSWLGFLRKHSRDQVSVAFLKLTVSAPPTPYQFQTQI